MENENYEGISKIYDMMMLGVDYEGWADYILDVAKSMGATPKTALDLACGTGSTTIPLARRGLKMSGLDLSSPCCKSPKKKVKKLASPSHIIAKICFPWIFRNPLIW